MDKTTQALADFALAQRYEDLTDKMIHGGVRHHLDGVGCAAGGFSSKPCTILRNLAARIPYAKGISAYGVTERCVPEYAVFANSSTNRHLDFNDAGLGPGSGGHPNDMTPAIVAAVEVMGGSGKDIILGTHIGYEIFAGLGFAFDFRTNGWDQGTQIGVATAVAVARLFGLDREGIANAISLTLTPGVPLRVTRAGELSHWKGCATAHASMNAYLAATLARDGLTGPPDVFEGTDAFWKQISHGPFNLDHLGQRRYGLAALERTKFKYFPAEYNSQGPVAAFLKLREQFHLDEVESIDVATYWVAWHEIGGGQGDAAEKWDPKTRESADHSLPFMTAVALVDGKMTLDSFTPERVRDPALRPLMNKITVTHKPEFDERHKKNNENGALITVRLKDGRVLTEESWHPKGSWQNPMTDEEVNVKFDSMIKFVLPAGEAAELRDMLWNLNRLKNLDDLTGNFRGWAIQ